MHMHIDIDTHHHHDQEIQVVVKREKTTPILKAQSSSTIVVKMDLAISLKLGRALR